MSIGIGDKFQNESKHFRGKLGGYLDWSNKPDLYKEYPNAKIIKLSKKLPDFSLSIIDILKKRRSIRSFSNKPLSEAELAFLLWASTGVQRREQGYDFRTAPSAGALYPIETYVAVNNVESLEKGLYHYSIERHAIEQLRLGNIGEELAHAALGQDIIAHAAVAFVWTAIFERSKWKYRQRAYRYIYLDAGHIGQNLATSATGIGLGSCQIGAFYDDEVNFILGIDGTKESAIYLSATGNV